MNDPFDISTNQPETAPTPPKPHWCWVLAKSLGCVAGGVGTGLLIVFGVLAFLMFVVAPWFLDQIYKIGS